MNPAPFWLAAAFLASSLLPSATAGLPGHVSLTYDVLVVSDFDFKNGFGMYDPADPKSPCTFKIYYLRGFQQPIVDYWKTDLRIGTNLNGPAIGISNLNLDKPGGLPLPFTCPIPQSGPGTLWLQWGGMNWRSVVEEAFAEINLCTLELQSAFTPGCLPIHNANLKLWVSACADWENFGHDYTDAKGKEVFGKPYDPLTMKNDQIVCLVNHSHDYTNTVFNFAPNYASQTHYLIKNEAIVHPGTSTRYMVVCWQIDYVDFQNPWVPVVKTAQTHDWKLIVDLADPGGIPNIVAVIARHLGGQLPGDFGPGGPTVALRGLYSESPTALGQNGFGPCVAGTAPETKKPAPLL